MKTFNWGKALGYGLLVWVVVAVLAWLSNYFGILGSLWTQLGLVLVGGTVSYLFALGLDSKNRTQSFGYGVVWIVVGILLDVIITMQVAGPAVFSSWAYWLLYVFILFAPMVEYGESGHGRMRYHAHGSL